ncbi:phosphatase PAP2 family protein [Aromatoleum anaerobium]|uniref:phosphatase PAP2 family protein n=1 Tax=Aromatoleum anaerobium TaxID=182180 RepID=UPI001FF4C8E5|nr:phosphatase PAP2 family protein [Aromatoleum anaerobium]MCK0508701.1 phosphatase PAP2 family protein [Aromatoleum anaerobium]
MRFLRNWLEPRILGIVAAVASTLWIFIEVAEDVVEGDTRALDNAILVALRAPGEPDSPLGPAWIEAVARDVTALGSFTVLGLVVAAVTVFLLLARRHRTAMFVLLGTSSGTLVSVLLKGAFSRPRPDIFPHGDFVISASFPSGHAMLSAIVYLTLGALLARLMPRRRLKLYVMSIALALTVIVGLSRIYLGVHWPTDVLPGGRRGPGALGWWGAAELVKLRSGERA